MRKSRFSEEQIIGILKEHQAGLSAPELCRKHGSDAARDARKELLTPGLRRAAVNWAMKERDYSQRRACALVGMAPKTYRYVSAKPDDAMLRSKLREMAHERRRFGYRRLHLLLRRAGVEINHKKLFRLYREERLTVRRRGGRKRAIGTRAPMAIPQGPNQRWSVDFMHDVLADGRRFRISPLSTTSPASAWR